MHFFVENFRLPGQAGLQKDRHRGTSGAKEGFSLIGRFSKPITYLVYFGPCISNFEILNGKFMPINLVCVQQLLIR